MRRHGTRGTSLVEVMVASAVASVVIGGALAILRSSTDLAQGTAAEDAASYRVTQALDAVVEEIRRSSAASVRRLDGTSFTSGGPSDAGFTSRRVIGYSGTARLGPPTTLRFDLPAGKPTGEIVSISGPVVQTVARGITAFSVTRNGGSYAVTVSTQSGDRQSLRKASGTVTVRSRNP